MKHRIIALLLSFIMVAIVCAGCQTGEAGTQEPGTQGGDTAPVQTEVKDTVKIALPKVVNELTGSKGGLNAFNVMFQI